MNNDARDLFWLLVGGIGGIGIGMAVLVFMLGLAVIVLEWLSRLSGVAC